MLAVDVIEPQNLPHGAVFHSADLRSAESVATIPRAAIERFGRADILINNAAVSGAAPSEDLSLEDWHRITKVNYDGTFLVTQAVGREMLRQGTGRIINISSRTASMGMPFSIAYNSTKAAIEAMTRTLAVEWGSRGILVNAIVPGVVRTPLNAFLSPEDEKLYRGTIPLGRFSAPDDLVGTAVFLSSPASAYITGAVIVADGGNLMASGIGTMYRDKKLAERIMADKEA